MCGIFGYIGKKSSVDITIDGLKRLEYRGYDSAGIAGVHKGELKSVKAQGKIAELLSTSKENDLSLDLAIGHTRWATHGKPSTENAHPHFDFDQTCAIVHNGIIENFSDIKKKLIEKGHVFISETDSEVIAHLVRDKYTGDLLKAVHAALQELEGALAIAVVHKDHPDMIVAASRHSPLALADIDGEYYLASDPNAFVGEDIDVIFLDQDEIAVMTDTGIAIYNRALESIEKVPAQFTLKEREIDLGTYEHYMLKEIYEQPTSLRHAMQGRMDEEYGTALFNELSFTSQEMQEVSRILILGCGTSWHAGCIGLSLFEGLSRIPSEVEIASEFRYTNPIIDNNTLVIAISQSGETADTIAALREVKAKGAKTLGICNKEHSTLARETDSCILLHAGPEISVASTKAFTSQITVLGLLALYLARLRHMGKVYGCRIIQELKRLPAQVEDILARADEIHALAQKYKDCNRYFFLGRRFMYPTSLEAALKLKEISYIDATGYPAGELKHGPIALIEPGITVVGLVGNIQTFDKMLSNLQEVKARGCDLLVFAPKSKKEYIDIADDLFLLPETQDHVAPILYAVATQLFAYYVAKERGTEIDQPRNLAKSVTVE